MLTRLPLATTLLRQRSGRSCMLGGGVATSFRRLSASVHAPPRLSIKANAPVCTNRTVLFQPQSVMQWQNRRFSAGAGLGAQRWNDLCSEFEHLPADAPPHFFESLENEGRFRMCREVLRNWKLLIEIGIFDSPHSADRQTALMQDLHVLLVHPLSEPFVSNMLTFRREIGLQAAAQMEKLQMNHIEQLLAKRKQAKREKQKAEQKAKRAEQLAKHEKQRAQQLVRREEKKAELEARREEQVKRKQRRAEQYKFERAIVQSGLKGNAMWPLHMILAGMHESSSPGDINTQLDVPQDTVQALQDTFGWTVSFSRALQEGEDAMRAWFANLGVDVKALKEQYQCLSQEAESRLLCGAEVQATDMRGVSRVVSMYRSTTGEDDAPVRSVVTSLLVHAPVLQGVGGGGSNPFVWKALHTAAGQHARVPLVFPQLHSNRPALIAGASEPVHHISLVLSPPRIMLAMRIAQCMGGASLGVQLTGVHGSGKSVFLKALAHVLPAGYPADVFLSSNAEDLRQNPDGMCQVFGISSGPLVDPRLSKSEMCKGMDAATVDLQAHQAVAQREWSSGMLPAATKHESLQQTVGNFLPARNSEISDSAKMTSAFFSLFKFNLIPRRTDVARVIILDEVNKVVKALDGLATQPGGSNLTTADLLWGGGLEWHSAPQGRTLRILAASPDGQREKKHERSDQDPFFELRPTRSDHLASVLAAAPEFITPREYATVPRIDSRAASGADLLRAKEACAELCGNMRHVAMYADELARVGGGSAGHVTALRTVSAKYVVALAAQLGKWVDAGAADEYRRDPDALLRHAAKSASMLVRQMPRDEYSSQEMPVGSAAVRALQEYLQAEPDQFSTFSAKQKQQLALLFVSDAVQKLDGASFEAEIEARLVLRAVSHRAWRMDRLPEIARSLEWRKSGYDANALTGMHQLSKLHFQNAFFTDAPTSLGKHGVHIAQAAADTHPVLWSKPGSGQKAFKHVVQISSCEAGKNSRVDAEVVRAVQQCKADGSSLLIRTVHNFPGVDFVVLDCDTSTRTPFYTVFFVETTISQLKRHAFKAAMQHVPPALRDIHRLTVQKHAWAVNGDTGEHWLSTAKTAKTEGEGVVEASPPAGCQLQAEHTSIANMWLSVLGCPHRIFGAFPDDGGADAKLAVKLDTGTKPTPKALSEAVQQQAGPVGDIPVEPEWDVRILYASASVEQMDYHHDMDKLESDMVYAVNKLDLNQASKAWAQPI